MTHQLEVTQIGQVCALRVGLAAEDRQSAAVAFQPAIPNSLQHISLCLLVFPVEICVTNISLLALVSFVGATSFDMVGAVSSAALL